MTGEIFSIKSFVWTCIWQSTVLTALGLAASFLLRHRSSRAHQVLLLSIISAMIVPAISTLVKHYELGIFAAEPVGMPPQLDTQSIASDLGTPGRVAQDVGYETGPIEGSMPSVTTDLQDAPLPWARIALCGWIVASLILAIRLLVTFASGVRLLGQAQPLNCAKMEHAVRSALARLSIDKNVEVCGSRGVHSPVIW
ncbi:MAG: hypothetical protein AMJ65_12500, partial [Phycisphaerae bacterium SG8_4]